MIFCRRERTHNATEVIDTGPAILCIPGEIIMSNLGTSCYLRRPGNRTNENQRGPTWSLGTVLALFSNTSMVHAPETSVKKHRSSQSHLIIPVRISAYLEKNRQLLVG